MISLAEARGILSGAVAALPAAPMALAEAQGRVLAEAVKADASYPAGDRATMDGYLIPADAVAGTFRLVGEIAAGEAPAVPVKAGECLRIFTGALLPPGGGRVVPQEDAARDGGRVTVAALPERPYVRPAGSEARAGEIVLAAGTVLGPAELAILAQVGAMRVMVVPAPVIHHVATGSELVGPEEIPGAGRIRDTNSTLLAGLVADAGVKDFQSCRCADDPDRLAEAADRPCDLLLISGGASVGDYDFGLAVLRRLGFTPHFDRLNLRPGKPLTFATRGRQAAFVIPGNPISHFVCFHVAIRLALERLQGRPPAWDFLELEVAGGEPLRSDPRETFWPARISAREGRQVVAPQRWSTSGDPFALAGTNGLIRVPADSAPAARMPVLPL